MVSECKSVQSFRAFELYIPIFFSDLRSLRAYSKRSAEFAGWRGEAGGVISPFSSPSSSALPTALPNVPRPSNGSADGREKRNRKKEKMANSSLSHHLQWRATANQPMVTVGPTSVPPTMLCAIVPGMRVAAPRHRARVRGTALWACPIDIAWHRRWTEGPGESPNAGKRGGLEIGILPFDTID